MSKLTHNRRTVNRSFDLFSVFDYYCPSIMGVVILLLMFLVGIVLANLIVILITAVGGETFQQYSDLISYPVMFIPAMIYAANKSRLNIMFDEPVKMDGANLGKLGWGQLIPMVIVATLAANFMTDPMQKLLPETPEWFEQLMEQMLVGKPFWATLLSVSVFAPLFEEWLCRGMILRGLMHTKLGPAWAIAISALIFAVIHMNPWQALPAFILGLIFGYVYYKTGSLKLTMLMHCANNTFAAILGQSEQLREMESYSEVLSSGTYITLTVVAVVIVIAFIVALHKFVPAAEMTTQGEAELE